MGRYLILLYQDETSHDAIGEDEQRALLAAHGRFQGAHGDVVQGGGWLAPTATATALRGPGLAPDFAAGSDAEVTDGPFVETKEALAGFYLVEAADTLIEVGGLMPIEAGAVVTLAGAAIATTDGPFVETKEALAGYYVVEAPDLDAALAVAREVPAPYGGVEVRPLLSTG